MLGRRRAHRLRPSHLRPGRGACPRPSPARPRRAAAPRPPVARSREVGAHCARPRRPGAVERPRARADAQRADRRRSGPRARSAGPRVPRVAWRCEHVPRRRCGAARARARRRRRPSIERHSARRRKRRRGGAKSGRGGDEVRAEDRSRPSQPAAPAGIRPCGEGNDPGHPRRSSRCPGSRRPPCGRRLRAVVVEASARAFLFARGKREGRPHCLDSRSWSRAGAGRTCALTPPFHAKPRAPKPRCPDAG